MRRDHDGIRGDLRRTVPYGHRRAAKTHVTGEPRLGCWDLHVFQSILRVGECDFPGARYCRTEFRGGEERWRRRHMEEMDVLRVHLVREGGAALNGDVAER
jgi:hypothetical protein